MITRSGIEVTMDAEASHPDALVAEGLEPDSSIVSPSCPGLGKLARDDCATDNLPTARARAVNFQVGDVKTHIEVLGHVPLGAGANPPAGPVVVAARTRLCENANARSKTAADVNARALQRAKDVVGLVVIADRRIAAVER